MSGDGVSSTRSATFDFVSLNRRSRRLREVTYFPSCPENGPLFDMNCILTVGSSISSSGSTTGRAISVIVSPTVRSCMPVTAQMSPAAASPSSNRFSDWYPSSLATRNSSLRAVAVHAHHAVARLDAARLDAADGHVAQVVVVIQRGDVHGQRRVHVGGRRRHRLDDHVEQRPQVGVRILEILDGPAFAPRGVDDGEVELRVAGAQRAEQVEGLVDRALGIAAGAVHLVDDQDRPQAQRQRLAGHEARLGHRPLERVDQQADRVDHLQHALDLAAEVGVAGGVDDVDARPLPGDGGELREDGDAALALEVVRVHRAVGDDLARAELPRLPQEPVHQSRLAVVDVRNDGDVADVATDGLVLRPIRWGRAVGRDWGCC